ncbi:MAG: Hpt domain-containing protein, partial [Verrucomicrobiales bacterium]
RDEDDGDPLAEFIDLFLQDTPDRLALIKSAHREKDWVELERGAHALKGSCGNIGALKMEQICDSLIKKSKAGKDPGSDLVKALQAEFIKLSPLLMNEKLLD